MINELEVGLDRSLRRRWGTMADDGRVKRTIAALEANGINVLTASDAATAKRMVLNLIPEGSQVHHGASQTLDVVGITDEIDKSGRYEALGPRIWSMDRKTEGDEIRHLGAAPDVMLGSVHAVTEAGSLLTASMSGSQLGPMSAGLDESFSSWGPRRSYLTSRRVCTASRSTPTLSKMPALRRHMAYAARSTRFLSSTARSPLGASPSCWSTRCSASSALDKRV